AQARAGAQERRARLPVAPAVAHVRVAGRRLPPGRSDLRVAQLPAPAGDADEVRRPARPAYAEGPGPDESPAPGGPGRYHRGHRPEDHPGGAGGRTRPPPTRRVATWEVQAL